MKNRSLYISPAYKLLLLSLFLISCTLAGHAQLNALQTMYYQNPYLYNPAMAGVESGLNLNLNYRRQWTEIPGAPKTASFTADFQPTEKVGLGFSINDDKAGLIRQTRVMATYAYHLQLSDHNQHLNFGLSLGIDNSHINYSDIVGDQSDPQIADFNQPKPYVDGDLGIAYTSNGLSVGGAVPNLRSAFFKTSDKRYDADQLLFITVLSYKFNFQSEDRNFVLEPLAAYRVVRGYKDIFDAGFNFTMKNTGIYIQSIYHTSRSINVGLGLDRQNYLLNFAYNIETGQFNNYSNGAFELGIKLRLFGK